MNLKVDIVKIINDERSLKAVADVVIDDSVVIHGVRLFKKDDNSFFVRMPSRKVTDKDGIVFNRDIVHPTCSSARSAVTNVIVNAYNEACLEQARIAD